MKMALTEHLADIFGVIPHMHHYEAELLGQSSYETRYRRLLPLFGGFKEPEVSAAHEVCGWELCNPTIR